MRQPLTPPQAPAERATSTMAAMSPGRLWLMVLGEERFSSHPLPAAGEVSLGRADDCDIIIDEPSVSRRHAVLRLAGEVTIEDLGSANGTRVGGQPVSPGTPVVIHQGDVIEIGSISVLVQRRSVTERPRRIWPHGYFEGRVDDECARAERDHRSFAVVVVLFEPSTSPVAIHDALGSVLRPVDVAGEYGAAEYEVLLVDVSPEQAAARVAGMTTELSARKLPTRTGFACFPINGRSGDELCARARAAARPEARQSPGRSPVVLANPTMRQLHRVIERVAPGAISVLLLGETGVGKEVLAELVHRCSHRADRPFLRLSCAALTETLLESELFGHEKGAFTGAAAAKPGLLETADGGTVFLDEIGELPMSTQVKLLRVLEERKVLRVGGLVPRTIDVRFVAATNRDLEAEILRGTFRQDLYYRLCGVSFVIPPLRARVEEIAPLTELFVDQACRQDGRTTRPMLTAGALTTLQQYAWPGNIRELRNVIERAVLLCGGNEIGLEHLPVEKMRSVYMPPADPAPTAGPAVVPGANGSATPIPEPVGWWDPDAADKERQRIVAALEAAGGNQTRAAELLGISRRTLLHWLDRFAIPRPRKGRGR